MLKHGQRKYELIGTVGMAAIAMLCAPLAMAKKPSGADLPFSKDHLVYVDFDKPNDTDDIPIVSRSNWPLGITITIPYDTFWSGEGAERDGRWYGGWSRGFQSNYIFFEQLAENCYYLDYYLDPPPAKPELGPANYVRIDKQFGAQCDASRFGQEPPIGRYIEFAADIDLKGTPDGENDSRSDLREDMGKWEAGVIDAELIDYDEDDSGWGIGTDDDLPSLFLYAEVGSGFVWNYNSETDERALARDENDNDSVGVRNLAGLSTSVSYSESIFNKIARSQEVEIHSIIQAPQGLLDPVVEVDTNPDQTTLPEYMMDHGWIISSSGYEAFSNEFFKWRVNGGEVESMPERDLVEFANSLGNDFCFPAPVASVATAYLMSTRPVTLKAFVVSGTAPTELFDENGDGDYVDDAIGMGHEVLSNVAEVELLIDPIFDLRGGVARFGPDDRPVPQFFKTSYRDLDALSGPKGSAPPDKCSNPNGATYIRREPR